MDLIQLLSHPNPRPLVPENSGEERGGAGSHIPMQHVRYGMVPAPNNYAIQDHGVETRNIMFLNLVCCPEGIQAMARQYPEIHIITGTVYRTYRYPSSGDPRQFDQDPGQEPNSSNFQIINLANLTPRPMTIHFVCWILI